MGLSAAWSSGTVRADALARRNGVWVKSADHTRRWLGILRASAANTVEDSKQKRFVYNYYNRENRDMKTNDTTNSWNVTGYGVWAATNGGAAVWKHEFVVGEPSEGVNGQISIFTVGGTAFAIALDGITIDVSKTTIGTVHSSGHLESVGAFFRSALPIGYHYLQALQTTHYSNGPYTAYDDTGETCTSGSATCISSGKLTQFRQ